MRSLIFEASASSWAQLEKSTVYDCYFGKKENAENMNKDSSENKYNEKKRKNGQEEKKSKQKSLTITICKPYHKILPLHCTDYLLGSCYIYTFI